jgi:hypothetical protein
LQSFAEKIPEMPSVIELVTFTFKPEANGKSAIEGLYALLHGVPGYEGGWWGKSEVDNNSAIVFIRTLTPNIKLFASINGIAIAEWDKVNSHLEFTKTAAAKTAMGELLGPVLSGAPSMHHVQLSPISSSSSLETAMAAPITEVAMNTGIKAGSESSIEILLKHIEEAKGCHGVCFGDVIEEVEGKKSVRVVIGWDSVEAHQASMKGQAVQDVMGKLNGNIEKFEAVYVNFTKA